MKYRMFIYILLLTIFQSFCQLKKDIKTKPLNVLDKSHCKNDIEEDLFQTGIASWYGEKFHGKRTASGEIYDMNKLTAAHKNLPFNTIVEIKNLNNQNKVIVRINDRGPFVENRIIDLSYKAALRLDMDEKGTAPVSIKIVKSFSHKKKLNIYKQSIEYVLQAGAFTQKKNAKRMQKKISTIVPELKFDIYFKNGFYRILSDRIATRSKAEKYKHILINNNIDVFIKEV